MRRRYAESEWGELKAAYLAGAEIRALARAASIPEGTALARAKREEWSKQRARAEEAAAATLERRDISGAIALESGERRKRHLERMADLTERIGGEVENLPPDVALHRIGQIDRFDRLTRRTLGMEDGSEVKAPLISIALLPNSSMMRPRRVGTPAERFRG